MVGGKGGFIVALYGVCMCVLLHTGLLAEILVQRHGNPFGPHSVAGRKRKYWATPTPTVAVPGSLSVSSGLPVLWVISLTGLPWQPSQERGTCLSEVSRGVAYIVWRNIFPRSQGPWVDVLVRCTH